MSRRHFERMAEKLKWIKPMCEVGEHYDAHMSQWKAAVNAMADVCGEFSATFDRHRFVTACGWEVNPLHVDPVRSNSRNLS